MHIIRKEWINIVDWKTSTPYIICSVHFIESDYSADGKKLKNDAKPSRYVRVNVSHVLHDHAYALPSADILAERLKKSEEETRSVKRELKKCKAEKRKLEDEIDGLDSVLRECKQKFNISQTSLEALEALSSTIPKKLFDRAAKKGNSQAILRTAEPLKSLRQLCIFTLQLPTGKANEISCRVSDL